MAEALRLCHGVPQDAMQRNGYNAEFNIFKICLSTNTMGLNTSVLIQEYAQVWEDLDTWRKGSPTSSH